MHHIQEPVGFSAHLPLYPTMILSLFSGALLFTTILGGSAHVLRVHESRYSAPRGFVATGPASPDSVIDLRVALVRNNVDGLIEALYDVSTPSSTKYGQFLNQEEVSARLSGWLVEWF